MAVVKCVIACLLFAFVSSSLADAAVVRHTFHVHNHVVKPLCKDQMIPTVNGSLPGPTINAREGDTIVVHVVNKSPYNVTIHWHGVQLINAWMDGANMITQCPIEPGNSFTYRFNIICQEGTLLWHAHVVNLRTTIHGALIIRPRAGRPYPFPKPYKEVPIVLSQWYNTDIENLQRPVIPLSDAFLINGLAGDSCACCRNKMYKLEVVQGRRYLLRIINAALNAPLFFKIANHNLKVVAVDAAYTRPYVTDVIVTMPGQTVDALLTADQPIGSYYMATRRYVSANGLPFSDNLNRALIVYRGPTSSSPATPAMPLLPNIRDIPTAHRFFTNITGLAGGPYWVPVPPDVDEKMFITFGLGLRRCPSGVNCPGAYGQKFVGSMNNRSFEYPESMSLQEAYFRNITGVYTPDFPDHPPVKFDYTNVNIEHIVEFPMLFPERKTSVKVVKFNSTVEIVLQNTAFISQESHPIHLHGFSFYVLGHGFGNYDPNRDGRNLNLVNPQVRNTVAVPPGGWAVLRFIANNPGVWMFHCHMDAHLPYGIITAFIVQNGPTPTTSLPPAPSNLPLCSRKTEIHKFSATDEIGFLF